MCDFLHALFLTELHDVCMCGVIVVFLIHFIMAAAEGCDLRQVGDADHLAAAFAHARHNLGHLLGDTAGDTGVYLVEDDCREFHSTGYQRFQRQHHAGNLTAGCHFRHIL